MDKKSQKTAGNVNLESILGGKYILDRKKVKKAVDYCKKNGLKIVLTQGSWDLIHIGHARYLREAKKYGDVLVVGVDSDKKIRSRKGPDRPIVPQEERLEMMTHLRYVDFVTLKKLEDPKWYTIKLVCPDVLIVTERMEYPKKELQELKKYCGKVVVLQSQATTSTSAKIRRLQINTAERLEKALTPRLIKTIGEVLDGIKK
jgi:D-beta-D-heptose 7-phosphate kinase/D-beta-D-heptose 1-phosphate adenosyltransferase